MSRQRNAGVAGAEDLDPSEPQFIALHRLDDERGGEDENRPTGISGPPPTYESVVGSRPAAIETSLDEVEASEDEQRKLLEFYKKRKEMEDAKKSGAKKSDGEDDDDESSRQKQNQERFQKMVRAMRRSHSGSHANAEELEMMVISDDGENAPAGRNGGRAPTANMEEVDLEFVDDIDASAAIRRSMPADSNGEPQDENRMEQGEANQEESQERHEEFPAFIFNKVLRGIRAWPELSVTKKLIIVLIVVLFIGTVLLVTLLPASFIYVEYHEYAFSRNKITGQIDYSSVYETGCYLLAPQDELVRFKATAHFVEMKLGVMNKEGMSIKLDIMLQYFLKRAEIEQLYKRYHMGYDSVMRNLIESTVKNTAITFKLDDFRLQRQRVEAEIFQALTNILSGDCCDSCCPYDCGPDVNCRLPHCRLPGHCYRGHHVEIKYFQMGEVWIPNEVMNRLLQRVILEIETEEEEFRQKTAMEVKQTELSVQKIKNSAEEVRQEAKARSRVILMRAEAERNKMFQQAYQTALKKWYSRLNVTSEDAKISLMYMRALKDVKDNLYAYNYDTLTSMMP